MVLNEVIEEHLDEADFLWQQRTRALSDHRSKLDRLAEVEERVLAHLDGLMLGKKEAWKLLEPKLTDGDRGEAFAAAIVLLESEDHGVAALVCDRLGKAAPSVRAGIKDSFHHASHARIDPMLRKLQQSDRPSKKSAAIDILSFRRATLDRNDLHASLRDNNIEVVRAAVMAIGRLRLTHLEGSIRPFLISDNMALRQEAIRTGLLIGIDSALDEARQIVQKAPDQASEMLTLLGEAGQARDLPYIVEALQEPALARNAIIALGLLGYVDPMLCLIQSLKDQNLARLAGEAMQLITGLDVEKDGLAVTSTSHSPHESDEEFEDHPDDTLPLPDLEALSAWWHTRKPSFDTRTRYRYGKPYSTAVLLDSLENASLPHRHHAAFELALSKPTLPYIETYAFSCTQLRQLARLNGI